MTPLWVLTYGATAAAAFEFVVGLWWKRPSFFRPGTYTWFRSDASANSKTRLMILYHVGYRAKWLLLLALPLGGWSTAISGLLLAVWFLGIDYGVIGRSHTALLGLLCVILALGGPPGLLFPSLVHGAEEKMIRYLCLILVCHMYLCTAFSKILDPGFRSGMTLYNLFDYMPTQRGRLRIEEVYIPQLVKKRSGSPPWIYKLLTWATIVLEIAIPVLLIVPATRPLGAALAIIMHIGFHPLLPKYLIAFMLASLTPVLSIPA